MRIVTYHTRGEWRAGVVVDGLVFDAEQLLRKIAREGLSGEPSVKNLLQQFGSSLTALSRDIASTPRNSLQPVGAFEDVLLGPPVLGSEKIICVGLNYRDHVAESGRKLPENPDIFTKFHSTLIGPREAIGGLNVTGNLDFEGEVAVVMGRVTRNVTESDALSHAAGLTVMNDITARDLQYRGTQWTLGKSVDGTTPMGPELVTLDEIADVQNLNIRTVVNGVEMQHSNTRHMIFPIARIIAYLSKFMVLSPGDIIATGTPEGVGAKRNPPVWLQSGDTVEVVVSEVGNLRNLVA